MNAIEPRFEQAVHVSNCKIKSYPYYFNVPRTFVDPEDGDISINQSYFKTYIEVGIPTNVLNLIIRLFQRSFPDCDYDSESGITECDEYGYSWIRFVKWSDFFGFTLYDSDEDEIDVKSYLDNFNSENDHISGDIKLRFYLKKLESFKRHCTIPSYYDKPFKLGTTCVAFKLSDDSSEEEQAEDAIKMEDEYCKIEKSEIECELEAERYEEKFVDIEKEIKVEEQEIEMGPECMNMSMLNKRPDSTKSRSN